MNLLQSKDSMQDPNFNPDSFLTPQEKLIMGGSVDPVVKGDDWYIPQALSQGMSIEEVSKIRKELKLMPSIVGYSIGEKLVAIDLKDIDPKTGKTIEDPEILGTWDNNTEEINNKDLGHDLTRELYRVFQEAGMDLHLREKKPKIESEGLGKETE